MGIAMGVKTALNVLLVSRPAVGIFGAVIAANVGYALSFALDFWFAVRATRARKISISESEIL
jgi:Na+-driven multidrug efflux pump